MSTKTLALATAVMTLGTIGATAAQAATAPRIAGSYSVKTTITSHQNNPSNVGSTATKTWKFTPSCTGSAGCPTTLVRPRNSGHPDSVSTVLNPVQSSTGTWHYKGAKTYLSACFLRDGRIIQNAYSTRETTNLRVTSTNTSNMTTAFNGNVVLVFTPTSSAPSACTSDKIVVRAQSIKKL